MHRAISLGILLSFPISIMASVHFDNSAVVHDKAGKAIGSLPNICKTPGAGTGPIPIPFPNVSMGSGGHKTSKVKTAGKKVHLKDSNFKKSTGDEAGTVGGIKSGVTKGKAEFVNYSFDVKVEGKNVARHLDVMLHNRGPSSVPASAQTPLPFISHNPNDVVLTLVDDDGKRSRLNRSAIIELADGTVCFVCMKNRRLTKMLRVEGVVRPTPATRRP